MMKRIFPPTLAIVILAWSQAGFAWGPNGHRIVAQIASYHLNPSTRKAITRLFERNNQHFNEYSLARIATWPDEIRSDPNWTLRNEKKAVDFNHWNHKYNNQFWHYVNASTVEDLDVRWEKARQIIAADKLEDHTHSSYSSKDIKDGYLLPKLLESREILRDPEARPRDKMTALMWVVHLTGDVHQPLHVGGDQDRGGNHVAVKWFGVDTNLHEVWDDGLIEKSGLSYTEYAQFLNLDILAMTEEDKTLWTSTDIKDWALESLQVRDQCYQWGKINWENQPELGYTYAFDNRPLLQKRLKKAGYRLAAELNRIFGDE